MTKKIESADLHGESKTAPPGASLSAAHCASKTGALMQPIFFLFAFLQVAELCYADGWIQKADNGGQERDAAVGFSINGKGYIGTGGTNYEGISQTFWEYDPTFDSWTQVADLPGAARFLAAGFSIDSLGYVGTGNISPGTNGFTADFWEFNPVTNSWTQKADFAGGKRENAFGFSLNGKGYIGCGDKFPAYKNDLWEYDPASDTWAQKADYGGGKTINATGFCINGKAYIGTGYSMNLVWKKDFWEYDPSTDVWTQKTDFAGDERGGCIGFSINGMGYFGLGYHSHPTQQWYNDFWQYDPFADTWVQKDSFPGLGVATAVAFVIGGSGYVGTGDAMLGGATKTFFQYNPDTATSIATIDIAVKIAIAPNPVSSSSVVSLSLIQSCWVIVDLLASNGTSVQTLITGKQASGKLEVPLNRENLSTGIYFLKIEINNECITKKIVVE